MELADQTVFSLAADDEVRLLKIRWGDCRGNRWMIV